jgi:hypothetical protein
MKAAAGGEEGIPEELQLRKGLDGIRTRENDSPRKSFDYDYHKKLL